MTVSIPPTTDSVSFNNIHDSLGQLSDNADEAIRTIMTDLGGKNKDGSELTTAQITVMQQKMQNWTYTRELEAKANEKLGDLMKSIVAKS